MILVWPLAGPEAWHEAAYVPGRVADRRVGEAVECPGASATPTPTAASTTAAVIRETIQRRRRGFPAAVPAAPAGWTGPPASWASQAGRLEAGPTTAAGTGGASGSSCAPAGADQTTSAACWSAGVTEPGRWWATVPVSVVPKAAWPVAAGRDQGAAERIEAGSQSAKSAADGCAAVSSARNCTAVGRCPGSLARQRSTRGRTGPGSRSRRGVPCTTRYSSAVGAPCPNGPSPVAANTSTAPRLNTSLARPDRAALDLLR